MNKKNEMKKTIGRDTQKNGKRNPMGQDEQKPKYGNEYRCYSVVQNRYLKENGLTPLREERHPTTHKLAFIYEKDSKLDELLTKWSENKDTTKRYEV